MLAMRKPWVYDQARITITTPGRRSNDGMMDNLIPRSRNGLCMEEVNAKRASVRGLAAWESRHCHYHHRP